MIGLGYSKTYSDGMRVFVNTRAPQFTSRKPAAKTERIALVDLCGPCEPLQEALRLLEYDQQEDENDESL